MANQNFQSDSNDDTNGPDMGDPNESSENELNFSTQDYPELEGLENGGAVKVTCQATVKGSDNGQVTLAIDPGDCQFETEGQADKAMKQMSHQDNSYQAPSSGTGEDF